MKITFSGVVFSAATILLAVITVRAFTGPYNDQERFWWTLLDILYVIMWVKLFSRRSHEPV